MIALIECTVAQSQETQMIAPFFVDTAVDFITVYADRTHHGKEENILFRDLDKKSLSDTDRRFMKELIEEHVVARKTTKALVVANARCRNGESAAIAAVKSHLRTLVDLYPKHIQKEDEVFFPASRAYLSEEEEQAMLAEFWEFDRKMIHEKYKSVVQSLEGKRGFR
jgi:hemerythrin-like domain-containing protein